MLNQEPIPDPKCKLIMSSFFTLPCLLHLIYTRDAMSIVLFIRNDGGCSIGGGCLIILGCGWGDRGWV